MFSLRPPDSLRPGHVLQRQNACKNQDKGVCPGVPAIVNHSAIVNSLQVVNLLPVVVFSVRPGPLGKGSITNCLTRNAAKLGKKTPKGQMVPSSRRYTPPNFLLPRACCIQPIDSVPPRLHSTQRAERSKKILEISNELDIFSSETEIFERATHRGPFFVGIRDVKIEIFERDLKFRSRFGKRFNLSFVRTGVWRGF